MTNEHVQKLSTNFRSDRSIHRLNSILCTKPRRFIFYTYNSNPNFNNYFLSTNEALI